MAVLSDPDRAIAMAQFVDDLNTLREPIGVVKADLRAAINAADAWVDTNAAAYNTALPQPFRGAATAKQKARLLVYVLRKRYEVA